MTEAELKTYIRDIRDFPKPGIVFKDITPLLAAGAGFQAVVERSPTAIAVRSTWCSASSRAASSSARRWRIASALGLAIVRKPGKLPHETYAARYELEYGSDTLEIHRDAFGNRAAS